MADTVMADVSGNDAMAGANAMPLHGTHLGNQPQQDNQQVDSTENIVDSSATNIGTTQNETVHVTASSTPPEPLSPLDKLHDDIIDQVKQQCKLLKQNVMRTLSENAALHYINPYQKELEDHITRLFDEFESDETDDDSQLSNNSQVPKLSPMAYSTSAPEPIWQAMNMEDVQPLMANHLLEGNGEGLSIRLTSLWGSPTADFTVVCGSLTLRVHEFVLSAQSGYFKTIFGSQFQEKSSRCLLLNEETPEYVLKLFYYMYSGQFRDPYKQIPQETPCPGFSGPSTLANTCGDKVFIDAAIAWRLADYFDMPRLKMYSISTIKEQGMSLYTQLKVNARAAVIIRHRNSDWVRPFSEHDFNVHKSYEENYNQVEELLQVDSYHFLTAAQMALECFGSQPENELRNNFIAILIRNVHNFYLNEGFARFLGLKEFHKVVHCILAHLMNDGEQIEVGIAKSTRKQRILNMRLDPPPHPKGINEIYPLKNLDGGLGCVQYCVGCIKSEDLMDRSKHGGEDQFRVVATSLCHDCFNAAVSRINIPVASELAPRGGRSLSAIHSSPKRVSY